VPLLVLLCSNGAGVRWVECLAASVALSLLSAVIVGPKGRLADYVHLLAAAQSGATQNGIIRRRCTPGARFLHRALQTMPRRCAIALAGGVCITLFLLAWSFRGTWQPQAARFDLQWAMMLFAITFCSPHTNAHDLCLLLVGLRTCRQLIAAGLRAHCARRTSTSLRR
jgi:hypothetical protein